MVVISESVHPSSLDFANQRKVCLLRDVEDLAFTEIAKRVVNLKGKRPNPRLVADCYHSFSPKLGRRRYNYEKCGRKPWKLSAENRAYLLKRLKELRRQGPCTCTTLQQTLARERGVTVEVTAVQKTLKANGYKWLPRSQKRKYSEEVKAQRLVFARAVTELTPTQLRAKLSMAMDGVVFGMPPADPTERWNFCRAGEDRMWRKPSEAALPELAGDADYAHQVPAGRSVAMWGGISCTGVAPILFHPTKKVTAEAWAKAVDSGKMRAALLSLNPGRVRGPWTVLCDNESFLTAAPSKSAHARARIELWKIPPKSPDLNPIEKFWSWLRRRLRSKDLEDAAAKKRPLTKLQYRQRIRALCQSARAQQVASACAKGLRKVCEEVVRKKGAASRA